jgi:hypothetical protein
MVNYYRRWIAWEELFHFDRHYITVNLTFLRNLAYVNAMRQRDRSVRVDREEHFRGVREKSGRTTAFTYHQPPPEQGRSYSAVSDMDIDETDQPEHSKLEETPSSPILAALGSRSLLSLAHLLRKTERRTHPDLPFFEMIYVSALQILRSIRIRRQSSERNPTTRIVPWLRAANA